VIIALASGLEMFEPSSEVTTLLDFRDEPEDLAVVSDAQKEKNSNLTTILPFVNENNLTYMIALWS
jgi:hypothetical protein